MSLKLLKKLQERKNREETGLFLIEGRKNMLELLASDYEVKVIYVTDNTYVDIEEASSTYSKRTGKPKPEIVIVTEEKLAATGTFKSNNAGIAIAVQRSLKQAGDILESAKSGLVLVLDDVRDPGNLGTIIRTADWFGVSHIVTSVTSTDLYNPKVIAASMGSFTRVSVTPLSLLDFLTAAQAQNISCKGAFLEGQNIFESKIPHHGLLIMGSESHGISEELIPLINDRLTIPRQGKAESLNVAIATGIILANLA